ncbi:MAG: single-stranded DNA-binding protein [Candidatus Uhrbacteria bacterium]|nr:single-stranded DNA-binding protein [Patescibacteria group bacterium]MBU1907168.1 single-stranded DNA-binding protein [Patescibacteria group bacterium]
MAGSLNKAMIIGNLTRDPELKQTPNGQSVCTIGVATNRVWNDATGTKQEQVEFHNVVAWGKLAEICAQYLAKGRKVYFDGRLQTRDWEGKDGVRRYRTEIVAENMIMLDKAGASANAGGVAPPQNFEPAAPHDEPAVNPDDEIKVEDIPF